MKSKDATFKKIIQENDTRLRNICSYYSYNSGNYDDLYQEVLLNIWKSLPSFKGKAKMSTWIYRIAINSAMSFSIKENKRIQFELNVDSAKVPDLITEDSNDKTIKEERLEKLRLELNNLKVIDKLLISLMLEEQSTSEMAEIIGITEPNVRTKLHRIKQHLKETLNNNDHE